MALPLTWTRPARMICSQALRDATPASARNFCSRTSWGASSGGIDLDFETFNDAKAERNLVEALEVNSPAWFSVIRSRDLRLSTDPVFSKVPPSQNV